MEPIVTATTLCLRAVEGLSRGRGDKVDLWNRVVADVPHRRQRQLMGIFFEKMPMIEHAILSASPQGLEYLHNALPTSRTSSFGH
jgi:hypothetical protein